jgi:hypothetical protein
MEKNNNLLAIRVECEYDGDLWQDYFHYFCRDTDAYEGYEREALKANFFQRVVVPTVNYVKDELKRIGLKEGKDYEITERERFCRHLENRVRADKRMSFWKDEMWKKIEKIADKANEVWNSLALLFLSKKRRERERRAKR